MSLEEIVAALEAKGFSVINPGKVIYLTHEDSYQTIVLSENAEGLQFAVEGEETPFGQGIPAEDWLKTIPEEE